MADFEALHMDFLAARDDFEVACGHCGLPAVSDVLDDDGKLKKDAEDASACQECGYPGELVIPAEGEPYWRSSDMGTCDRDVCIACPVLW